MNLSRVYRKKEGNVIRQIAGETLLVPLHDKLEDMQKVFVLNKVASYIWQCLDGRTNLYKIQSGVLTKFWVEREEAEPDIEEFIGQLLEAEIIEEVT